MNGHTVCTLAVTAAWLCLLAVSDGWAAEDQGVVRLGVSISTLDQVQRNDASAALKVWAETGMQAMGLKTPVETRLIDSFDDLQNSLGRRQIEAVTLTTDEMQRLALQPDAIYLPVMRHGFHVRYVLLVHRQGGISRPGQIHGRDLVLVEGQRMALASIWLERLLAEHAPEPAAAARAGMAKETNPSKAILQVFFRQAAGVVVSREAFELACELNPQLHKDLAVLAESPPLITSFFIFRPDWLGPSRQSFETAMLQLHTTAMGQQVLTIFKSTHMEKQPVSILDATRGFLAECRQRLGSAASPAAPNQ